MTRDWPGRSIIWITGLVYFITNNMEVDVRVGVGLTDHSSDYLTGAGMSIRY